MNKKTFIEELNEYKRRGGQMSFVFGDIHLPVIYRQTLGVLSVKTPAHEVSIIVDYNLDLGDNLHLLMNHMLEKYPQLEE